MGRTMLNVSGSMTNAIVVDKIMGTFDEEAFKKNKVGSKASAAMAGAFCWMAVQGQAECRLWYWAAKALQNDCLRQGSAVKQGTVRRGA